MLERELSQALRRNPDLHVVGEAPAPRERAISEHDLQVAVIAECDRLDIPIFAIPNGGLRNTAVAIRLKQEGVRAGIPDLFIPIQRHGYAGMFLELKVGANKPSEAQRGWIDRLKAQGYRVDVVWDSAEAVMERILWYLEMEQQA